MWSTSALLFVALMSGTPQRAAAPTSCPVASGGVRMTGGDVYDGPVEENAILVPDSARTMRGTEVSTWDVRTTYAAGRQIYLSCEYASRPKVTIRVSRAVRTCRYSDGRPAKALACR